MSAYPTFAEVKREHVLSVLVRHNWRLPAAAAELDVSVKTVYNWLHQWEREGYVIYSHSGWRLKDV